MHISIPLEYCYGSSRFPHLATHPAGHSFGLTGSGRAVCDDAHDLIVNNKGQPTKYCKNKKPGIAGLSLYGCYPSFLELHHPALAVYFNISSRPSGLK